MLERSDTEYILKWRWGRVLFPYLAPDAETGSVLPLGWVKHSALEVLEWEGSQACGTERGMRNNSEYLQNFQAVGGWWLIESLNNSWQLIELIKYYRWVLVESQSSPNSHKPRTLFLGCVCVCMWRWVRVYNTKNIPNWRENVNKFDEA